MKLEFFGLVHMPEAEYRRHAGVGHSDLRQVMRSPAHYRAYIENPPQPTPQMAFGTAFHAALLESDRFEQEYVVAPEFNRRTKEGKAAAEAWEAANAGKTALTEEQMRAISAMVKSVRAHAGAAALLANGHAELCGFWRDQDVACKFRADFVSVNDNTPVALVDVKTCQDASSSAFSRAIASYGYDVQAGYYVDGFSSIVGADVPFYFIAVEKDPPYAVAVYRAADEVIESGRAKYRAALHLLKWCRTNNEWPAYQPKGEIETISLPRWAANLDL